MPALLHLILLCNLDERRQTQEEVDGKDPQPCCPRLSSTSPISKDPKRRRFLNKYWGFQVHESIFFLLTFYCTIQTRRQKINTTTFPPTTWS